MSRYTGVSVLMERGDLEKAIGDAKRTWADANAETRSDRDDFKEARKITHGWTKGDYKPVPEFVDVGEDMEVDEEETEVVVVSTLLFVSGCELTHLSSGYQATRGLPRGREEEARRRREATRSRGRC